MKFLTLLLLLSCGKQIIDDAGNTTSLVPTEDSTVQSFMFATSEDKVFEGYWQLENGEPAANIRINFYSEKNGSFLGSTLTNDLGAFEFQTKVSSNLEEIYARSNYIGAQEERIISLSN